MDAEPELRWVEAGGWRHAIDGPRPKPDTEITALCGEVATVGRVRCYGDPECPDCDRRWRDIIGIPQREEHELAEPEPAERLTAGRRSRHQR